MKAVGRTVMVGTKLEEFGAEVMRRHERGCPKNGRDNGTCRDDRGGNGTKRESFGHEREPDL